MMPIDSHPTMERRSGDVVQRARRRRLIGTALDHAAWWLVFAAAAGLILLMVDRIIGLMIPLPYYAILLTVGLAIGIIRAVAARPSRFEVARSIDRRLALKDQLATAELLATAGSAGGAVRYDVGFAAMVRAEARRLAGAFDVRTVAPIQFSRLWWPAMLLAAAVLTGARLLPAFSTTQPGGGDDGSTGAALVGDEPREVIRESLERARDELREAADELPDDETSREAAEVLDRLADQLRDPAATESDLRPTRDVSAATLNEVADELADQARRDRRAGQELTERFAGIEPPDTPMSAAEFQDALRRGEFGAAADRLAEQLDHRDRMTEAERAAMARHLRELSEQVESERSKPDTSQAERAARIEQALRDQGLDEDTIRELMEQDDDHDAGQDADPDRTLRERNIDPEVARRLAREIERQREEREINEQVERDMDQVRDALDEAAREFERDPSADPSTPDQPSSEQSEPGRESSAQDQPSSEGGSQSSSQEPQPQPGSQSADQPAEQSGRERERQPGSEQDRPREEQGAGDEPGTDDAASQSTSGEQSQQPSPRSTGQPGDEAAAARVEENQPDGAPAAQPSAEGAEGQMPRDPAEALRELADRGRQADRRQEVSESMRQRAREMLEQMSPEERRELFEELQRHVGGPPSSSASESSPPTSATSGDPSQRGDGDAPIARGERVIEPDHIDEVDMQPENDPGEVIAEWLSDETSKRDPDAVARSIPRERLESARRIAERAVNESAVPSRYHRLIRRYFRQLPDAADAPSPPPSPSSSSGASGGADGGS